MSGKDNELEKNAAYVAGGIEVYIAQAGVSLGHDPVEFTARVAAMLGHGGQRVPYPLQKVWSNPAPEIEAQRPEVEVAVHARGSRKARKDSRKTAAGEVKKVDLVKKLANLRYKLRKQGVAEEDLPTKLPKAKTKKK